MKEKIEQNHLQERKRAQRKEDKWEAKECQCNEDIEYLVHRLNELEESHDSRGIKTQK